MKKSDATQTLLIEPEPVKTPFEELREWQLRTEAMLRKYGDLGHAWAPQERDALHGVANMLLMNVTQRSRPT